MKKSLSIMLAALLMSAVSIAQSIVNNDRLPNIITKAKAKTVTNSAKTSYMSEDFELVTLPTGWTETHGSATTGWQFGSNLSSQYWTIPAHTNYAAANDDACNCDMSNVLLSTDTVDLSSSTNPKLTFDYFFTNNYGGFATIKASINGGTTWDTIATLAPTSAWTSIDISLLSYSGDSTLIIGFHYNDGAQWATGLAIDNVIVDEAPTVADLIASDKGFVSEYFSQPMDQAVAFAPEGSVYNNGLTLTAATKYKLTAGSYSDSVSITTPMANGSSEDFSFASYTPTAGVVTFSYNADFSADYNPANNVYTKDILFGGDELARDNGVGAGQIGIGSAGGELGNVFTISAQDTLTSIKFKSSTSIGNQIVAIVRPFTTAPGASLGQSIAVTSLGTDTTVYEASFDIPVVLPAGKYFIGLVEGDSNLRLQYTSTPYVDSTAWAYFSNSWHDLGALGYTQTYYIRPQFANIPPYKVLVVDDDNNGSYDESFRIDTALVHAGVAVTSINIGSGSAPIYDTLKNYDLVIWSTANDGTTNLWDVSDTATLGDGAVKFNAALTQYLDSNGTLWVDGLDFLYDVYGSAPRNFTAGDFVYDQMGINKYVAQSHADDNNTGLAMALATSSNMTLDTVQWKYSTVWYADALDITATSTPLYEMGPSTYMFAGKKVALYNGNIITSSLRLGAIGSNGSYVQSDIDQVVGDFVNMIRYNLTPKTGDIVAPLANSASVISPTIVKVVYSEAMNSTATDTLHYTGLGSISSIVMNATNTEATITLANALTVGQSYSLVVEDLEDASGNIMDAPQSFNIIYNLPVVVPNLVITEIMYNGPEGGTDTTEFIEIYNNDTMAVNLAGYYFVQGVNDTLPNYILDTNSYFVMALDSVKFSNFFGVNAHQWISGGLSNGGEDIILVMPSGDTVDIVDYDDGGVWPSEPDGNGPSLTLCNPNLDNNNGANWTYATTFVGVNAAGDSIWANPGTGCGNVVPPPTGDTIPPVVNNAMLASGTSVEVYFSEPVGVSAETTANYTGLGTVSTAVRNTNGDMVTLTLAAALVDGVNNTLTIDNVKDTSGNVMAAPQNFDLIYNGSTADLLITEIMYNDPSASDSLEYFEIYNNGASTANIGGMEVTQGVEFVFPANTTLNAGDYLVIAKDAALVDAVFGVSGTLQWTSGGLKNSGEDIAIQNSLGDTMAYVDYDDASPWPVAADGDGPSLEFCDKSLDNNDGANWSLSEKFAIVFNGDSIFGTPGADCYHDAINLPNSSSLVSIYPNPATSVLYITTDNSVFDMSIFDVSGRVVMEQKLQGSNNTVNIKSLRSGMYYIQFINTKTATRFTKKLIVK